MTTTEKPAGETQVVVVQVFRLSKPAYEALEKELPVPYADNDTSVLAAGYKLGVQAVLKKLREGYAVDY